MKLRALRIGFHTLLVCAIAICAWTASDASGDLSGSIVSIEDNTVNVQVVNGSVWARVATIRVHATVNGWATTTTSTVTVPGGGSVIAPIVVGTITDDIDPLDVHFDLI